MDKEPSVIAAGSAGLLLKASHGNGLGCCALLWFFQPEDRKKIRGECDTALGRLRFLRALEHGIDLRNHRYMRLCRFGLLAVSLDRWCKRQGERCDGEGD